MAEARDQQAWEENAGVLSAFDPHRWDPEGNFIRGSSQQELDVFGSYLRKLLVSLPDVRVCVDLGCGVGLWVNLFEGFDYLGVDQNLTMLDQARKNFPSKSFVQGNGRDLSFLSPVDLIFTRAVIQHNQIDKALVLEQIYKALKPGGYYLCAEHEDSWANTTALDLGFRMLEGYVIPAVFLFRRR